MNQYVHERPPEVYCTISTLTEILLEHCEKHSIVVWPEFGSLLGLMRHNGVIPWDYDGDFGMMYSEKQKLLTTFSEVYQGIMLDQDYYSDPGCLALRYTDNKDDVIDVIFYRVDDHEEKLVSMLSERTKTDYVSKTNYAYDLTNHSPLTLTTMLGHNVYIPNKPEKILETEYGDWKKIPDEFQNFVPEKYLSSPFKEIPTYSINKFTEFINIDTTKNPIILKDSGLLSTPRCDYDNTITNESEVFGYIKGTGYEYETFTGMQVWDLFSRQKLNINIVDSPVTDSIKISQWMGPVWLQHSKDKLNDKLHYALTWIVTNAPKVTHFHVDPEYGDGYMKLLEGRKIWWCVLDDDVQHLASKGYTKDVVSTMRLFDVLKLDNFYLWGKIFVGSIEGGDIIRFPVGCLHKVFTTKNSYGFGGYV